MVPKHDLATLLTGQLPLFPTPARGARHNQLASIPGCSTARYESPWDWAQWWSNRRLVNHSSRCYKGLRIGITTMSDQNAILEPSTAGATPSWSGKRVVMAGPFRMPKYGRLPTHPLIPFCPSESETGAGKNRPWGSRELLSLPWRLCKVRCHLGASQIDMGSPFDLQTRPAQNRERSRSGSHFHMVFINAGRCD